MSWNYPPSHSYCQLIHVNWSILGPLLFIIYINDLAQNLKYSDPILYADDTNLILHKNVLDELIEIVYSDLNLMQSWYSANKLSLNISKTIYMLFHAPQHVIPENAINIQICNS